MMIRFKKAKDSGCSNGVSCISKGKRLRRQIKLAHVEGGYVHLNVQHDPLVLLHVDSPDTVLAFIICFRPVRREYHSS